MINFLELIILKFVRSTNEYQYVGSSNHPQILYRALQGEQGAIFAHYAVTGSYIHQILGVVDYINQYYD